MKCISHGEDSIYDLYFKLPRCTYCGHRIEFKGKVPKETRRMMPWKWILELFGRYYAKLEE